MADGELTMKSLLLLLALSAQAFGAYGFVGSTQTVNNFTAFTTTDVVDTTAGNFFVAVTSVTSGLATLEDSLANSCWAPRVTQYASGLILQVWDCVNPSTSSFMNFKVSGNDATARVMWFSGGVSSVVDIAASEFFNFTSWPMATYTPGFANELIIAAAVSGTGTMSSIDESFTLITGPLFGTVYLAVAYRIETTLTPVTPTWTPVSYMGGPAELVSYRVGTLPAHSKRSRVIGGY